VEVEGVAAHLQALGVLEAEAPDMGRSTATAVSEVLLIEDEVVVRSRGLTGPTIRAMAAKWRAAAAISCVSMAAKWRARGLIRRAE
jgi:hypothetical protein